MNDMYCLPPTKSEVTDMALWPPLTGTDFDDDSPEISSSIAQTKGYNIFGGNSNLFTKWFKHDGFSAQVRDSKINILYVDKFPN